MIVINTESLMGREVEEVYGLVSGSTVRAKHIGKDIMAGFKNIFGGEIKSYSELLEDAQDKGANAVINVRFSTSSIAAGAAEIYVYGTAVKLR